MTIFPLLFPISLFLLTINHNFMLFSGSSLLQLNQTYRVMRPLTAGTVSSTVSAVPISYLILKVV